MDTYRKYAAIFRALSDETRLKIFEMLSCGEMCACAILEYFKITQPTLSYHMKILTDSNIINRKKEGTWIRYSLNHDLMNIIQDYWNSISAGKDDCICHEITEDIKCEQ